MLSPVSFRILDREITYNGPELRPHWVLEQTGQYGSLLAAFLGPCDVRTAELVDWEDKLANDSIKARRMLHVVGELFGTTLETGIHCQRLFMVWAEKLLRLEGVDVERRGDDLFVSERKLSVSIATASPVSVLIHWGLNVDAAGAPPTVRAIGLSDLGWDDARVLAFAKNLLTQYIGELEDIRVAQCKVRPVL